ncbi:MAG TPA: alpha-1,4-glucan--maltose-1-phosphate maltosyltransferase [Candidatus Limnocylindrales bacterium]|nr:alpha-1,4-glucan--maltose-1-phosphate maltosyltransferase [Candidatus Limnocylindrales bacterium]
MSSDTRMRNAVGAKAPASSPTIEEARKRVLVEDIRPRVDCGRYPAKRVLGDEARIEADLVADSHDVLGGRVLYRHCSSHDWLEAGLRPLVNDRFFATFELDELGRWEFLVEGWIDALASWRKVLERKIAASEAAEVVSHLRAGAPLMLAASARASDEAAAKLQRAAAALDAAGTDADAAVAVALDVELAAVASATPDLARATRSDTYEIDVESLYARFGAWYEFFPRSCRDDGTHATFADCEARLQYAASMGFDIVYLPPIHPIGESFRKGKDNSLRAAPGEPGSPWAIGASTGGHKSVHPELGTLEDFRSFLARAEQLGLRVALDIALQVSPDHPYVKEHPQWFVHRPDGSIQYAENPPKKYQDIYPFDFQCEDAPALWRELTSIFEFWVGQGVRIFRVDNPHTKSLMFWRHCIAEIKRQHPDVIFLAEAFTRPKLMYALARLGFSQSYTYFTWRNTRDELTQYFTELTRTEAVEFFRPNLWPNTPDILPESLQFGGRPAFVQRLVLAATLGASYGIYGPAFELMESQARPGSGEYMDNEKYEIRRWEVSRADSLRPIITRVNAIRRENAALHDNRSLRFHQCANETLLCYSKRAADNVIVVVVNLDVHHKQSGFVELDLDALGIEPDRPFQAHDLLGGGRYLWHGSRNYVELDPHVSPAQIFRVRRRVRTEYDFDYFV